MRCGDDDTAVGLLCDDGHLRTGRGAETHIDHIGTGSKQRTDHQVANQLARETGIASDNDTNLATLGALGDQTRVGRGEFYNINRGEIFTLRTTYGASDTRNRLDECHGLKSFDTYII